MQRMLHEEKKEGTDERGSSKEGLQEKRNEKREKEEAKEPGNPEWGIDRKRETNMMKPGSHRGRGEIETRKRLPIFTGLSKHKNKEDKNNKPGKYLEGGG